MTDLKKLAKGKPCMLRIPNVCNWRPETTVLCHIRITGTGGSRKPTDLAGVWGCSDCHDVIDRRNMNGRQLRSDLDAYERDALVRQMEEYERMGIFK